ncbi:MAG: MBL fold metallo-hydrolase [Colwellia sp.]|nr:MBL fold metallo-hydrolase [Colwellia sp.]
MRKGYFAWLLIFWLFSINCFAHITKGASHQQIESTATAQYLGNEAILFTHQKTKILFDPFFHKNFGIYQLVPEEIKKAIMSGTTPYNDIDAIFISHAHDDHFNAQEVADYLKRHSATKLFCSKQAAELLRPLVNRKIAEQQVVSITLNYQDKPWYKKFDKLIVEAVRIPHAGWPSRAEVENLVFRVTLNETATVMHMGDADPDDEHFIFHQNYWQKRFSHINFPPYWFYFSAEGRDILNTRVNAKNHVGIHVPVKVPSQLKKGNYQYFSEVTEQRKVILE